MIMSKSKLPPIPNGISSFMDLREGGFAFVDKTAVIEELENQQQSHIVFLRPRRFGKTVLTSMLLSYYDISQQAHYDRLFAGTYIYNHPTPNRGQFYVLQLDFSGVECSNASEARASFTDSVKGYLLEFFNRYPMEGQERITEKDYDSPVKLLNEFLRFVAPITGKRLYIIIDEYDQFANNLLVKDREQFREITSVTGFLKSFYASIKAGTRFGGAVARSFITGATSLSLDAITSGFNIQKNISQNEMMAESIGFSQNDLHWLIGETIDLPSLNLTEEYIMNKMKLFYNGYRFSCDSEFSVYNASMCLNYLTSLRVDGREPGQMLDPNNEADIRKIAGILDLADKDDVRQIVDAVLNEGSISLPQGVLSGSINLNSKNKLDLNDILSVLFSLGFLTFAPSSSIDLCCPNKAILAQFFRYRNEWGNNLHISFEPSILDGVFSGFAKGDLETFMRYFESVLKKSCGLHMLSHMTESVLQLAMRYALLTCVQYVVRLESEALGEGFCDLWMRPVDEKAGLPSYLIELKYLHKNEANDEKVAQAVEHAEKQLRRYEAKEPFSTQRDLRKYAAVFGGFDLKALKFVDVNFQPISTI